MRVNYIEIGRRLYLFQREGHFVPWEGLEAEGKRYWVELAIEANSLTAMALANISADGCLKGLESLIEEGRDAG